MRTYRERLDLLVFHACSSDLKRAAQFKQRLDALEREYPTFDKIVELAKEVGDNPHIDVHFFGDTCGRITFGKMNSALSVEFRYGIGPGKAALEALQAELARRKAAEPEPPAQVESEELRRLREENRQLREIAEFHDAWQTRDGAWVHRDNYVHKPATEERAVNIPVEERGEWYSKPEAAKAAIGKEEP